MNELMIFENPEFGKIRSVQLDGEAWLVGKDVAEALGYTNPRKALADHVDEEDKRQGNGVTIRDPMGREQTPTVINESGLYSLVLSSKLPGAKRFRRWVTSEVLPTLRRQGTYTMQTPKSAMELLRLQSQAMFELDERVNVLEDKLENQMTIDHGQQRELQKAVSRRVLDRAATVIPAWALDEQKPKFFASLYRDLKDRFGVPSYRDIRPADYPSAMAYVETWIEPAELRRKEG
jgi:prophage antirepressor-like protein|nr:MAG TPA: repressor domain protein [Caudoviricetes sp.]